MTPLSVRQRQGRLSSDAVAALNSDLAARFGNRFTASEAIRQAHGHTLTWLKNEPPDAVVFAEYKDDVIDLVKLCARHDAPIVPFGIGSSLEGHVNAPHGGVSLDLSRMNNVLAVNAEDLDCVVEPGVTRKQLNEHLRDSGLFFPIDPGADASLGGMAATRASGTNAVRYGTMKDVVLSLGVVVADGSFLRTGTRAKKSSAGYDLTHMFIGSEGTLGIIVEMTLKLSGIPEAIAAGIARFPTSARLARRRSRPSSRACRSPASSSSTRCRCAPSTLIRKPRCPSSRCSWSSSTARSRASPNRRAASATSPRATAAGALASATRPEERNKLWQARHDTYWSQMTLRPGARPFATDACVPISRLADCVDETLDDIKRSGLVAPIVGHVGDGNFHVTPLIDLDNPAEIEAADAFAPASPTAPSPWAAPAPASTGSARRSANIWKRSTARSASTSCGGSRPRSIRENLFNPGKVFYA